MKKFIVILSALMIAGVSAFAQEATQTAPANETAVEKSCPGCAKREALKKAWQEKMAARKAVFEQIRNAGKAAGKATYDKLIAENGDKELTPEARREIMKKAWQAGLEASKAEVEKLRAEGKLPQPRQGKVCKRPAPQKRACCCPCNKGPRQGFRPAPRQGMKKCGHRPHGKCGPRPGKCPKGAPEQAPEVPAAE
ncbi:MAG: hypothetical protein K6B46_06650 [Opitutales bacterium]|nr:hypothetical protein [Opitutales bacterium]